MSNNIILYVVFLIIGIFIGINRTQTKINEAEERYQGSADPELKKKIHELEEKLVVYENLRQSLLADVKHWRDRAEKR
jgi:hypothetical protein